jgi:antitoxin (DNA-binding transcriptional repressor) of toxin-antitoxin stability system
MDRIRMSEAEVVTNFAAALDKLRDGAEIIVESDHNPVAVIRPPQTATRSISECMVPAKEHQERTGHAPTLDPDFAADVEAIISARRPWTPPAWD